MLNTTDREYILRVIAQASERIHDAYHRPIAIEHKGNDLRNEVTSIDREVSTMIIEALRAHFPNHAIYSEEQAQKNLSTIISQEYLWTIDPIDGTSNFSRHIPIFSTVVSLLHFGVPIFCIVSNPITNETFMFVKGEGVTRNGVQKETSKKEKPKDVFALIRAGRVKKYHPWITKIMEEFLAGNIAKHANFGASAYDLSLLASGSIEAVIYATMTTIDIAGAIGMVREAGGEVYSAKGIPVEISYEPQPIIAVASSALFEKMKPLLHLNLT